MSDTTFMEKLVSLCKRRGFVYPASEIYGGLNGFWDYGPLGVQLKNNIRDSWWKACVESPPLGPDGRPISLVGLDSAIIQNPQTWVASGHVGGFSDPMSTCKQCKKLVRADHVGPMLRDADWVKAAQDALEQREGATVAGFAKSQKAKKVAPGLYQRAEEGSLPDRVEWAVQHASELGEQDTDLPCPHCGGELTEPRDFNLMFETFVGAIQSGDNKAYLRPETAQGIFLNYKNVLDTMRVKVPFGIGQIGKSFRNEVTPRNFIFRSREFEQMEIEWFCHPDEAEQWFDFWKHQRMNWWRSLGVAEENLRFRDHDKDELSHYAKEGVGTVDIEYKYPFTAPDFGELEGIAHRTNFDLSAHAAASKTKMEYFDETRKEKYIPHVIEPAAGLTRAMLVVLCEAFKEEEVDGDTRTVMKIAPHLAPTKAAIFPLVKKDGMPEKATAIYDDLRGEMTCFYDEGGAVGRRYRRQDEIGTPYCVTVDGDTLSENVVTVRDRDSMQQEKVNVDNLKAYLREKVS